MRHGRRDANHVQIREALRRVVGDDNVRDTADLGDAFPDLVVGWKGVTYMLEIKAGPKAPLKPDQERFMSSWRGGPWRRVDSIDHALAVLGIQVHTA